MKKMKKLSFCFASLLVLAACLGMAASAADKAYAVKIYGDADSGAAMNQGTWDQFYNNSGYYVYFQIDFNIKCSIDTIVNQQVTGDTDLKPGANTKIKLNGRTVKQLNDAAADSYGVMIAYEPNSDGNLRMSVWMGGVRGEVLNKDKYNDFTVELLDGLKVPAEGYAKGNGKVVDVSPVKYKLSIVDLEYGKKTDHPAYNADKADWVKPMFETLKAQWVKVSGDDPPGGNSGTTATTRGNTTAPTTTARATGTTARANATTSSGQPDGTAAESADNATTENTDAGAAETTAATELQPTETKDAGGNTGGGFPVLPVVLAVVGVLVIGGAVGGFLFLRRKQGTDEAPDGGDE